MERFVGRARSRRELMVIAVLSVLVFAFSATFDIFNKIISWVYSHDTWQLDELFTVAIYLVVATAIYAWRRYAELIDQVRRREQAETEKARLIPELDNARADVSALKKLLPICSSCKRVRDDTGYWNQVEVYIESHLLARLDDGICPDCARKLYGNAIRREQQ
jgi:hypothetical protein